MACAIRRDHEPATRCTRCTPRLASPHARYSAPDAVRRRHARHHASAHPSPDPHRRTHGQCATLPRRLRRAPGLHDRLEQCTALWALRPPLLRSSVPPSTRPASSTRHGRSSPALLSSPSHAPPPSTVLTPRRTPLGSSPTQHRRPQHLWQPLSTARAAFVASPRALAILSAVPPSAQTCPRHIMIPRTRRAPPAARAEPAAVVPHRARHGGRLPIRCDRLQHRPTVCSKPGSVTQREYDANHHQRTQHMLQLFLIIHTTFVPSPRANHLQRRSASLATARIPCLHVPRYSPQHHLCAQRAPLTFATARTVPIAADHRADPFRRQNTRGANL
ncbi:hypothetical protein B0H14DRAFT_256176 [Mycena olivaceomarginata]|nr:hypothetical protein B0H14DRAFT_256176 [Mycena olivaceomarginata]